MHSSPVSFEVLIALLLACGLALIVMRTQRETGDLKTIADANRPLAYCFTGEPSVSVSTSPIEEMGLIDKLTTILVAQARLSRAQMVDPAAASDAALYYALSWLYGCATTFAAPGLRQSDDLYLEAVKVMAAFMEKPPSSLLGDLYHLTESNVRVGPFRLGTEAATHWLETGMVPEEYSLHTAMTSYSL